MNRSVGTQIMNGRFSRCATAVAGTARCQTRSSLTRSAGCHRLPRRGWQHG